MLMDIESSKAAGGWLPHPIQKTLLPLNDLTRLAQVANMPPE